MFVLKSLVPPTSLFETYNILFPSFRFNLYCIRFHLCVLCRITSIPPISPFQKPLLHHACTASSLRLTCTPSIPSSLPLRTTFVCRLCFSLRAFLKSFFITAYHSCNCLSACRYQVAVILRFSVVGRVTWSLCGSAALTKKKSKFCERKIWNFKFNANWYSVERHVRIRVANFTFGKRSSILSLTSYPTRLATVWLTNGPTCVYFQFLIEFSGSKILPFSSSQGEASIPLQDVFSTRRLAIR